MISFTRVRWRDLKDLVSEDVERADQGDQAVEPIPTPLRGRVGEEEDVEAHAPQLHGELEAVHHPEERLQKPRCARRTDMTDCFTLH